MRGFVDRLCTPVLTAPAPLQLRTRPSELASYQMPNPGIGFQISPGRSSGDKFATTTPARATTRRAGASGRGRSESDRAVMVEGWVMGVSLSPSPLRWRADSQEGA